MSPAAKATQGTPTPLQLGRPVRCRDGTVGRLADVVIEPDGRRVTHLVVEDRDGAARLVPARLLVQRRSRNRTVELSCSSAEVGACESIRSFAYVGLDEFPRGDAQTDIGIEEMLVLPTLGAAEFGDYAGDAGAGYGVVYDRIPSGSAELRRASRVVSVDGRELGTVDGFLVADGRTTHVVLQTGRHGRPGAPAIPIEAVETIETDRVTVRLPKPAAGAVRGVRSRWLPLG
jgi:sporulation protein YlmC with PRC-barrel domain